MMSNKVGCIDGVMIKQLKPAIDARGSFTKFHPFIELSNQLDSIAISFTAKAGTIRGLHFQVEPFAEEKLVTCLQGSIFDVIVDLRPNSITFGKWASLELSMENSQQAYLPRGVAHGFQTLAPDSIVHYCLSDSYSAESSYAINPFGDLGITWPLEEYSIAERDEHGIEFSIAAQKYAQSLQG